MKQMWIGFLECSNMFDVQGKETQYSCNTNGIYDQSIVEFMIDQLWNLRSVNRGIHDRYIAEFTIDQLWNS